MNSKNHRSFFSNLIYSSSGEVEPTRIFSPDEIALEPLKWLKRLMLVRQGLSSMEVLESEISRFPAKRMAEAKSQCLALALEAHEFGKNFMIVLKIVPRDTVGLIPNYRVYYPEAIDDVFSRLEGASTSDEDELWYCLSIVDSATLSLGGRVVIPSDSSSETVELVWYTSPRLIEEFNGSNFDYPFLRARRHNGEIRYRNELLYVPDQFQLNKQSRDRYVEEGNWAINEVWRHRSGIDAICGTVFRAGAREISIEFRVNVGNLVFIDWDTDVELLL